MATVSRRHAALRYPFPGRARGQMIKYGLRVLLSHRENERARAESARSTRHDIRRSRDLRTGFGGRGAPLAERDRLREAIDPRQREVELEYLRQFHAPRALDSALWRNRWSPGDWKAGRFVLTEQGLSRLAAVLFAVVVGHEGFEAGLGVRPASSADSAWLLAARMYLTDDEIGQILVAADRLGPGPHGTCQMDRELEYAGRPQLKGGRPEAESKRIDRLARITAKRWARMRELGYGDTRAAACP